MEQNSRRKYFKISYLDLEFRHKLAAKSGALDQFMSKM